MVSIKEFGNTAKGLSRNPLGIIALFIVLIYGMASLVVGFSGSLKPEDRSVIVWFLFIFPFLVLVVFAWLVAYFHGNLYAPYDFKSDESFMGMAKKMRRLGVEVLPIIPKETIEKDDGLESEILKVIEERDAALDQIAKLQKLSRELVDSNNELGALLENVADE